MKYGIREIFEVEFFDSHGNFITKLDSLKTFNIIVRGDRKGSIHIADSLYDSKLLEYMGYNKNLKVICEGVARDYKTGKDHVITIVIDDLECENLWSIRISDQNDPSVNHMLFRFTKVPKIKFEFEEEIING